MSLQIRNNFLTLYSKKKYQLNIIKTLTHDQWSPPCRWQWCDWFQTNLCKIINRWSRTARFQIHLLEPGAEIDEDVRAGLVEAALFAHRPAWGTRCRVLFALSSVLPIGITKKRCKSRYELRKQMQTQWLGSASHRFASPKPRSGRHEIGRFLCSWTRISNADPDLSGRTKSMRIQADADREHCTACIFCEPNRR